MLNESQKEAVLVFILSFSLLSMAFVDFFLELLQEIGTAFLFGHFFNSQTSLRRP